MNHYFKIKSKRSLVKWHWPWFFKEAASSRGVVQWLPAQLRQVLPALWVAINRAVNRALGALTIISASLKVVLAERIAINSSVASGFIQRKRFSVRNRQVKRRYLDRGHWVSLFLLLSLSFCCHGYLHAQLHDFTVEGDISDLLNHSPQDSSPAQGSVADWSQTDRQTPTPITELYAYYMTGQKNTPDTIEVRRGKYRWQGKIDLPEKINLMVAGNTAQSVILFIEPGRMHVRHTGSFSNTKVSGSKADEQFRAIEKKLKILSRPVQQLREQLQALRKAKKKDSLQLVAAKVARADSLVRDQVYRDFLNTHPKSPLRLYAIRQLGGGYVIDGKKIDHLFKALPQKVRQSAQGRQLEKDIQWSQVAAMQDPTQIAAYIRANPGSPVALEALKQYAGNYIQPDKVRPLFELLPAAVRNSEAGKEFQRQIQAAQLSSLGQPAPLFTQKDTAGHDFSLKQLRGKYVLLDFWASWCVPCRAQSPVLVKAYQQYKSRGFTILGVALERPGQQKAWLDAIGKDHLAWYQVSDFTYWQNQAAQLYGVMAIPQNFLIDPKGKIIGKNLLGDALLQELSKIFNHPKNHQ